MIPPLAKDADTAPRAGLFGLLRRNGWALLLAAGLTILVHMAIYAAASAMASPASAVATLLGSLLWIVVAAPMFAAGGRSLLEGLLRGAAVIDAGIVVLVVLAAGNDSVGPLGAVKVYLVWCAVALAGCAAAQQARRVRTRHVLAAVAVAAVVLISAGPFWANGMIHAAQGPWRDRSVLAVTASNPVYATVACLGDTRFVWHEMPLLYEFTVLDRDVPIKLCPWYPTAGGYAAVALLLMLRARLARRRRANSPAAR